MLPKEANNLTRRTVGKKKKIRISTPLWRPKQKYSLDSRGIFLGFSLIWALQKVQSQSETESQTYKLSWNTRKDVDKIYLAFQIQRK